MLLPLKTQEDLDRAVLLGVSGLLRVLLKTPKNNHVSPPPLGQDQSPPPGTTAVLDSMLSPVLMT